jgi:hypothetical protein
MLLNGKAKWSFIHNELVACLFAKLEFTELQTFLTLSLSIYPFSLQPGFSEKFCKNENKKKKEILLGINVSHALCKKEEK